MLDLVDGCWISSPTNISWLFLKVIVFYDYHVIDLTVNEALWGFQRLDLDSCFLFWQDSRLMVVVSDCIIKIEAANFRWTLFPSHLAIMELMKIQFHTTQKPIFFLLKSRLLVLYRYWSICTILVAKWHSYLIVPFHSWYRSIPIVPMCFALYCHVSIVPPCIGCTDCERNCSTFEFIPRLWVPYKITIPPRSYKWKRILLATPIVFFSFWLYQSNC